MGIKNINVSGFYIKNICARNLSIEGLYIKGFWVKNIDVGSIFACVNDTDTKICYITIANIKNTCIRNNDAIKCLRIYLQLFQILDLKQYNP